MAFTWPVNAPVTQDFGQNPSSIQPNGHTGRDFGVQVGTPVLATGAGKIVFEGWATTLSSNNPWWLAPAYAGIVVVIEHYNGLISIYGHLSESFLNIGDTVTQGQKIGASGNTGLSTGPHLHFEIALWPLQPYNGFYGRVNPSNYVSGFWTGSVAPSVQPTRPDQRLAGDANVNQRSQPNTTSEITRIIAANTLEEFTGYVRGESVAGIDIWYTDAHGFAWAGGFTDSSTNGLPDKTPVNLRPDQRKVGPDNVNQRSAPNTTANVTRVIAANSIEEFDGYVLGEEVAGINIWYTDATGYTWAGGFTDSSTNGMPDKTPKPTLPNERTVVGKDVNQRKLPNTSSEVVRVIAAGSKEIFTHYAIGQKVEDIDLWYKDADGYAWAGGFTEQKTDGLESFIVPTPEKPVDPVTPVDPQPVIDTLDGIDISSHQAGIETANLDADFVIIKVSEGVGWTDPQFVNNITKARATNKLIGFYHFARPLAQSGNTAKAEADSFLKIVKKYLREGDVIALDWEAENQNNTSWAKEWLDLVAKETNSKPLIYMNQSAALLHDWSAVKPEYKLWLAQYPSSNINQGYGPMTATYGNVKDWDVAMWQYSSSGRLAGWNGNLDLNIFYGTVSDWKVLGVNSVPAPVDPTPAPEDPTPVDPETPIEDPIDPPVDEKARLMSLLEEAVNKYLEK